MSEQKEGGEAKAAAPAAPAKSSPGIVGLILPGILAAAGAVGGAKFGAGHAAPAASAAAADHGHGHREAKPPGPTMSLEPFILTVLDANKKSHTVKVTIAIEFEAGTKEDSLKAFIPRVRDATVTYFRALPYEECVDPEKSEKNRKDLLERFQKAGAVTAERVLLTDLVSQ